MTSSITTIIFTLFYASVRQMLNSLETKIGIKSTLIIYKDPLRSGYVIYSVQNKNWLCGWHLVKTSGRTSVAGFQLGSMDHGFSDEIHRVRKIAMHELWQYISDSIFQKYFQII